MVKANAVSICKECAHELPDPLPDRCPNCDRLLKKEKNQYFASPDYLRHQMTMFEKEFGPRVVKDKEVWPLEDKNKLQEVSENLRSWAVKCPPEDKLASMNDALLMLQHVAHSECSRENIKMVVGIGKRIGKLAEAIEEYFSCGGGAKHEREIRFLPPDPRTDPGSQEATR